MNEFEAVLNKMIILFREWTTIQSLKLQAIKHNQVAVLEDYLNKEQPMVMRLRGLELEREKQQALLGFQDKKFQQILEEISEEEKEELVPLFHELSSQLQVFQEMTDNVNQLLQMNLHQIDKKIDRAKGRHYRETKQFTEHHITNQTI